MTDHHRDFRPMVSACTSLLSALKKTYKKDRLSERMEMVGGKDNEVETIIKPIRKTDAQVADLDY